MSKNLFNHREFESHSGRKLKWKIECDALNEEDLESLAKLISSKFKFRNVVGIPTGGIRLAKKLKEYEDKTSNSLLIVDDVLTTGKSMKEEKKKFKGKFYVIIGVVIFSRTTKYPRWIHPIFVLNKKFKDVLEMV